MAAAPVSNSTVEVKAAETKTVKAEAKAEAPKAEAKKAEEPKKETAKKPSSVQVQRGWDRHQEKILRIQTAVKSGCILRRREPFITRAVSVHT